MELSELGLSEEQLASVNEYTAGLKAKNDELLSEKKAEQAKANEATQATELARQEAVKAEEARLKLAGDVDGLKQHYEQQLAEQVASANQNAEKAQAAQLESSVAIEYVDGKPVASIKDGDASYASSKDFLDGVKESDTWKHVLIATSLSGAGTKQSNSVNVDNKSNQEAEAAKEKGDLTGFLQASLKGN